MKKIQTNSTLKVRKALVPNHNQSMTKTSTPKVCADRPVSTNHNQTSLKVRKGIGINHIQTKLKVHKGIGSNHNQVALKVRKGIIIHDVRGGNHNQSALKIGVSALKQRWTSFVYKNCQGLTMNHNQSTLSIRK